jgi:hypothetical protein
VSDTVYRTPLQAVCKIFELLFIGFGLSHEPDDFKCEKAGHRNKRSSMLFMVESLMMGQCGKWVTIAARFQSGPEQTRVAVVKPRVDQCIRE